MKNPYETLGVAVDATEEQITKAYRDACKKNHPDKGGCEERMREINAANEILSDPDRRKKYDETGDVETRSLLDEARSNLAGMFSAVIDHARKGSIVNEVRRRIRHYSDDMAGMRDAAAVAISELRDAKSRVKFTGEGPNLLAEIIQGEIDRYEKQQQNMARGVEIGEEMARLLNAYSIEGTPKADANGRFIHGLMVERFMKEYQYIGTP